MSSEQQQLLQFVPFSNALDNGFWHVLTQLKLDVYRIDDKPVKLMGYYCNSDPDGIVPHLNVDSNALSESFVTPPRCYASHGMLKNTNTMEDFKNLDKMDLLKSQGRRILDDIISGQAIEDPSLLSSFLLLTYADLKKYHYYYWFAFPAVCIPERVSTIDEVVPISQRFSDIQIESLVKSYDELSSNRPTNVFLVRENSDSLEVSNLRDFKTMSEMGSKILLGFCDPCTLSMHPGWPLRNILALVAYHWSDELKNKVEVICLRDRYKDGVRQISHSIVLNVSLPSVDKSLDLSTVACVGWEKNEHHKSAPRVANLSTSMDPVRLAESSVDLNLKLMKWRLLPDLDIDAISRTKCLLLGSGTLGCNVARCLLGWGVRVITLVDNCYVSYSNPVRQSLFVFDDCLNGGQHKADAAARSLKQIFPGVNATGINLSIPMPGHAVAETCVDQVQEDVTKLENLIEEHDVVFLLMDTRESRWLPTVIGASKRKIVFSAALGFDTYLVVRHGVKADKAAQPPITTETTKAGEASLAANKSLSSSASIDGNHLGCYFCNDVVAPGNSTHDRTLDQQCTVTRPGLSMMAAASAVELLVTLLEHPLRGQAAADTSSKDEHLTASPQSSLGLVPHQIRGFLSRFHVMLPASLSFDKCTACSDKILETYEKEGFNFLMNAFNRPSYLEDLTGLTELHADTEKTEIWDFSDFEDDADIN